MKRIYFTITIIISLYNNSFLFAEPDKGKDLYLIENSARSLGRGGTGVTGRGSDFFLQNSASIAELERTSFSLQFGTLDLDYYQPDATLAIPTAYGTFGTAFRYFNIPDAADFDTGYAFSIGGARDFTSRVLLGMRVDLFYGSGTDTLYYAGGNFSILYKFNSLSKQNGLGVYNPRIGLSADFGVPVGGDGEANLNKGTLGYSFDFYRSDTIIYSWYNEVTALSYYEGFPIHIGLEATIANSYIIRAGGIIPISETYEYSTITGGIGYKVETDKFAGTIDYALGYSSDQGLTHNIGLTLEYGDLDREPPVTKITPDKKHFSPNYDGTQDYVIFRPDVEDESTIESWKLQIKNSKGKIVKEYKTSDRDTIEGLTAGKFFSRLFQKKTSQVIPEKILWDGADNKGKPLPDGKYSYSFFAMDERGNISTIKKGKLFIDNTPPEITVTTPYVLFSPNGDKRKDTLRITQKVKTDSQDTWNGTIKNAQGKIVRSYSWKGIRIPRYITWDGTDEKNNPVPEGLYYYTVESKDKAGNGARGEIREISLTRQIQEADITLNQEYFSYNKDKGVRFFPRLSSTRGLQKWKVEILDDDKDVVKRISSTGKLPAFIDWNGVIGKNKKLQDGIYYIQFKSEFDSGNAPASFAKKLVIDSSEPNLSVSHSPGLFSPDNDGENDILTIKTKTREKNEIKSWDITLYAENGAIFKTFTGTGIPPKELKWDGLDNKGEVVESAADYEMILTATDAAGNKGVSKKDKVRVDILVIVTERGLKMRISNIEFAFNSAKLRKRGVRILDRVGVILEKYARYDVIIEGHTDNIGTDEQNLILSEKRAQSVLDYLVERGIEKVRLEPVGMGESTPVRDNKTEEGRRRNRRVEFLLIKQEEK